jgi:hypothetical protein
VSSSPINTRYHRERTIRTGRTKLAGWSPKDVAELLAKQTVDQIIDVKRRSKGMPPAKPPPVLCPRCGHDLTGGTSGDSLVHRNSRR